MAQPNSSQSQSNLEVPPSQATANAHDVSQAALDFAAQVANNPATAYAEWTRLNQQEPVNLTPTNMPSPSASGLDTATIAAIVAQVIAQSSSPQTHPFVQSTVSTQATAPSTFRSEKLPDVEMYDGDKDYLDAWEQRLVQKIMGNEDRFPTDAHKIFYAESRLALGKRADNLMRAYRTNKVCNLTSFHEYRKKLRELCGDRFEAEKARDFLRSTRQDKLSFEEYYNNFLAQQLKSNMGNDDLLDCFRKNVRYDLQDRAMNWRFDDGRRPVFFEDYIEAYRDIDSRLAQIKYNQPRQTNAAQTSAASTRPRTTPLQATSSRIPTTSIPVVAVTPAATPVVSLGGGEPMDLSAAIAAVQGKSTKIPGIRELCSKWNLCFYCKLQHSGGAKECPNKKTTNLRTVDFDDTVSIDGGVTLSGNV